jgi:hypothetical protein
MLNPQIQRELQHSAIFSQTSGSGGKIFSCFSSHAQCGRNGSSMQPAEDSLQRQAVPNEQQETGGANVIPMFCRNAAGRLFLSHSCSREKCHNQSNGKWLPKTTVVAKSELYTDRLFVAWLEALLTLAGQMVDNPVPLTADDHGSNKNLLCSQFCLK